MEEGGGSPYGEFGSAEAALGAARGFVDGDLAELYQTGMSAEELFRPYTSFGSDPYIVSGKERLHFSAWDYANERCLTLCDRNGE
jgi:hypothetical protein